LARKKEESKSTHHKKENYANRSPEKLSKKKNTVFCIQKKGLRTPKKKKKVSL